MKKKGFTLTELLAVIVILGVITLIAVPTSFAISNRIKINMFCNKMDIIKKAADLYGNDHYDEIKLGIITRVAIKDLVNYGYLKKDQTQVGSILVVDPRDNTTSMDDINITLKINNNRVKTSFEQENYYYLCGDNKLKDKKDPTCLYQGESTTWTNQTRTITISCYDAGAGCKTADVVKTYSSTKKHDSYSATVRDWVGNSFNCSKSLNVYVDKTKPTYEIVGQAADNNDWSNKRTIIVKCVDPHSGCKTEDIKFEYGILASDNNKRNVNTDTISFTLEDNAGNKKTYTEEVNVYTDVDNPTCVYYGDSESWTNEDRTIQIACNDTLSGCKVASTSLIVGTSASNEEIGFVAEDKAGNQTNCTKNFNVYVDKVKPVIGNITFANGVATIPVSDDQGLVNYEIYNSSNTKKAEDTISGLIQTISWNTTTPGTYTVKVYDVAGNVETKSFTIPAHTITFAVNDSTMGSVAKSSATVTPNGSSNTTFTVNEGYHYVSVSGSGCSVSGSKVTASNVTSNVTCTVNFAINTYTVAFVSSDTNMCTVADASKTVEHGADASTTFSAKTGYQYKSVSGCTRSSSTLTVAGVTEDTTCTVTCKAKSITCEAGKYLKANSASCSNCEAGYYCPGGTWTYDAAAHGRGKCPAGSAAAANASECTACQSGSTSSAGASSCGSTCSNNANVNKWNTASWSSSNNTVTNNCSINKCNSGYALTSNSCLDITAPTTPTTLALFNPVMNPSTASYSLKVSGSTDVSTITYQVKINGSWKNCNSSGQYNVTYTKGQSYTVEARACDSASNCSGSASTTIIINAKRLYVWQLYQYMRANNGTTIINQPSNGEVAANCANAKMAQNAKNMYLSTEAQNYTNSVGVNQTVKNFYRGILGRDFDSSGYTSMVNNYNSQGRSANLTNFVNSSEAQDIYTIWNLGSGKI